MTRTGTAVDGPLPPDEVWERYARPGLWSGWAPQIRDVEVDVDRMTAGLTGRVQGWGGLSVDFVVDSWDDDARSWTWTVRPRLAVPPTSLPVLRLRHGVRPSNRGSQAWLVIEGPAVLVFGYLLPARLALYRLTHP
jgi:hypothetical protein